MTNMGGRVTIARLHRLLVTVGGSQIERRESKG